MSDQQLKALFYQSVMNHAKLTLSLVSEEKEKPELKGSDGTCASESSVEVIKSIRGMTPELLEYLGAPETRVLISERLGIRQTYDKMSGDSFQKVRRAGETFSQCFFRLLEVHFTAAWECSRIEIEDFLERLVELGQLFFGKHLPEFKEEVRSLWTVLYHCDDLITQLKYSINVYHNTFYDLEMPPNRARYVGLNLFPYLFRRCLHTWVVQGSWRRANKRYLINSLFQGWKKGFLPVQEHTIAKTIAGHIQNLTSVRFTDEETLNEIERVIRLFPPLETRKSKETVSTRASWEVGFADAGHYGFATYLSLLPEAHIQSMNCEKAQDMLEYKQSCQLKSSVRFRKLISYLIAEEEFVGFGGTSEIGTLGEVALHSYKLVEVRSRVGPTRSEIEYLVKLYQPLNVVAPAFILEPMKVRTITKPGAMAYHGLQKIQQDLWSSVFEHWTGFFSLIGEPLRSDHLIEIAANWDVGKKFASGDFSSATDCLHSDVSRVILEHVLQNYALEDPLLYQKAMDSMLRTTIDYSNAVLPELRFKINEIVARHLGTEFLATYEQENGQLMGNILSFPILCLANYCSYHVALERRLERRLSLFQVKKIQPVRINGDDIGFCSDQKFYDIWLNVIKSVGFEPSLGKNHFSDKILQLNSQTWYMATYYPTHNIGKDVDSFKYGDEQIRTKGSEFNAGTSFPDRPICIPKVVGFCNFGLITNRKKGDSSRGEVQRQSKVSGLSDKNKKTGENDTLPEIWKRLKCAGSIWESQTWEVPQAEKFIPRIAGLMKKHSSFYYSYFKRELTLPWDEAPSQNGYSYGHTDWDLIASVLFKANRLARKEFKSERAYKKYTNAHDSLSLIKQYGKGFDYERTLVNEIEIHQNWKNHLRPLLSDRAPYPLHHKPELVCMVPPTLSG